MTLKNTITPEDIAYREKIHLRNLKRAYNKIKEHPELTEEALKLKKQIQTLESQTQ